MRDDGLVVSPVDADIDVQMDEGHTFDANTVLPYRPTERGVLESSLASGAAGGKTAALGAALALQPLVPAQRTTPPTRATPPTGVSNVPPTRVTSVVPAMFVPLRADADLTQPFDPPRSGVERAKVMLGTLEYYRTGVREGFMYLADMDRQYIIGAAVAREKEVAEARAAAAASPQPTVDPPGAGPATGNSAPAGGPTVNIDLLGDDETISHDEIDVMIATMRAPAVPGVDYNMAPHLDQHLPLRFPPEAGEVLGGRREAVRQLNEVVEQALLQMAGYEVHIGQLRAQWTDNLEREQKLLDERLRALPGDNEAEAAAQAEMGGNEDEGVGPGSGAAAKEPQDVAMSGT